MENFDERFMRSTARKPPLPPIPRNPKPHKSQPRDCPITTEVIQRIRRVMADSRGKITTRTIAEEIDRNPSKVQEWIAGHRSNPSGEALAELGRWLAQHDRQSFRQVFEAKEIVSIGEVVEITRKLTDDDVRLVKNNPNMGAVELATRLNVSVDMIYAIRDGSKRGSVQ